MILWRSYYVYVIVSILQNNLENMSPDFTALFRSLCRVSLILPSLYEPKWPMVCVTLLTKFQKITKKNDLSS